MIKAIIDVEFYTLDGRHVEDWTQLVVSYSEEDSAKELTEKLKNAISKDYGDDYRIRINKVIKL